MKDNKEKLKKTMIMWLVASLILGVIVYPLTNLMPLNKKLYSISFAILTSASSGLTLLFFVLAVDIVPEKYPSFKNIIEIITRPLLWLGRNPLAVFVMMDAVAIVMIKYITIDGKSLWA
jgi:heparan-alpha-glucosaminide N-acetyltransferase